MVITIPHSVLQKMKKILIIDDDEIFAKTLQDFLPKDRYETRHVRNGADGLDTLEEYKPDLIILDLIMPILGGMEFLEELGKKENRKEIPILISSQLSKIEDISKAVVAGIEIGVKGYIIKASENLNMIMQEIEKTLAKYSSKNESSG